MHHGQLLKQFIKQSGKTISGFSRKKDMPSRATIERDISQDFLSLQKRLLYAYGIEIQPDSFDIQKFVLLNETGSSTQMYQYQLSSSGFPNQQFRGDLNSWINTTSQ